MKKVVIIILNWNKWQETVACLNSVYKSNYSNYEVLLIDNGSSDCSVEKIRSAFPNLRMIVNTVNIGFTGGCNQGMRLAVSECADYIWLLNNDTEVDPDCLAEIIAVADGSDNIGLVSPAICYFDAPEVHQFRGSVVDWDNFEIIYKNDNNACLNFIDGEDVCLWGTALLVNSKLIEKIGYLSEDYFAYYEDTLYSLNSLMNNYKNIYCSSAKILHKHSHDENEIHIKSPYYYYYMIRNEYFLWKDVLKFKFNKKLFKRICLKSISRGQQFQNLCYYEHMEVIVQAIFDALFNKRGKLNKKFYCNYYFVKFLLWHPYILINFLMLDFKDIKNQISKKIKSKSAL